jgi:hypothetical protein
MREPWSIPIPQAMQQHGGVSKAADGSDPPLAARQKTAASAPREIDAKEDQTIVEPAHKADGT